MVWYGTECTPDSETMKLIVWSREAESLNTSVNVRRGWRYESCVEGEVLIDTLSVPNALDITPSYPTTRQQ